MECLLVGLLCVNLSCSGAAEPVFPRATVTLDSVAAIATRGGALLVDPADASEGPDGALLVTDRGDKVIKRFGPDGAASSFGRPGSGPGEFTTLLAGGLWGGHPFGYDMVTRSIHRFVAADGVRTVQLSPDVTTPLLVVRASEDDRLVGTGWLPPNEGPAIHLFDADGALIRSFFPAGRLARELPARVASAMGIFADVRDGRVFTAMFGHDTVIVFDTLGRELAATSLVVSGDSLPVLRIPDRARSNGGELRRPDGTWIQEGALGVRAVVALGDGFVAVQLAPVDFARPHDIVADGGPVVVLQYVERAIRIVQTLDAPGALLGRDRDGHGIVLRWDGAELSTLTRFALRVTTESP